MLVVMPAGMSNERLAISRAYGAEVLQVGHFHVDAALEKARELGRSPGYFCPSQFESEWNVEENREIWDPRSWRSSRTEPSRRAGHGRGYGGHTRRASGRPFASSTRGQALRHGAFGVLDHHVR
jgi:cysteine synthase